MKKSVLTVVALLATTQAFALDSACMTKQKNAASFKLAQELAVAVQGAEIIG